MVLFQNLAFFIKVFQSNITQHRAQQQMDCNIPEKQPLNGSRSQLKRSIDIGVDRSWILRRAAPALTVLQECQRNEGFCHLSCEQLRLEDYLWIMILTLVLKPLNKFFPSCAPFIQPQPSFQTHMPCKKSSQSLCFWDRTSPTVGQESREVRAARDFDVFIYVDYQFRGSVIVVCPCFAGPQFNEC